MYSIRYRVGQLEETYNDHQAQVPDHFRAGQKLKHVIKRVVQMPLKHWQAWGIDHLSRPVPVLTTLSVKKCFLMSSLNLPWCSFEPLPRIRSLEHREKSSAPPSPRPLLRKLQRAMRSPLNLLFSKLDKPGVLSCSSHDMPSSPSTSFVALLCTRSRTFTSFLSGGAQNCTQYSRWGPTNAEYRGTIPSFDRLVVLCLMHSRWGLPSGLLGHPADSCGACCPPAPPDPFPQGCFPATPLPICTCAWHHSVLESHIFFHIKFHAIDDCPMLHSI